jgi:type II secretory pathway component PulF
MFPPMYVALIRVGEASGSLDQVLEVLADERTRTEALKRRLGDAIRYPLFVLGAAGCVLLFFLTFVLPQFASVLRDFGQAPTGVVGGVTMTLVGPFYWSWMAPADWGWMALVCMTSISSHYFLIRAYDVLDAAAVQPLTYLSLVYASVIGMVIYDETLSLNMIAGSIIVVAAGIFTVWREHVVGRRAAAAN